VEKTFQQYFPLNTPLNLKEILPDLEFDSKYKVRIVYDAETVNIEYSEYYIRNINSLKLIFDDNIQYKFKSEDRKALEYHFNQRGNADDILIIKNNCVTDSFYANPVFWNGKNWILPETSLLEGTKRQYLQSELGLKSQKITTDNLHTFSKISLVNSMLDIGDCEIPIENLIK
jgi:4-amino-4-deoxychorismate lyase